MTEQDRRRRRVWAALRAMAAHLGLTIMEAECGTCRGGGQLADGGSCPDCGGGGALFKIEDTSSE